MDYFRTGGEQLKSHGGPKKNSAIPKGQIDKFLPIQRVHLSRKQAKRTKFWALQATLNNNAGHIWPGPYVVHPCFRRIVIHIVRFKRKQQKIKYCTIISNNHMVLTSNQAKLSNGL